MISIAAIRKFALGFEGITEEPHFEKISFRFKKKIAVTIDSGKNQAVVKLSEENQSLFSSYNNELIYPVKGTWGKMGYTVVDLKQVPKKLVEEIIATGIQTVKGTNK